MSKTVERCNRKDSNLAEIVQLGVTLQQIAGRNEAVRYLIVRGVQLETIQRVLAGPGRRRLFIRS
jgi:hypothetical protein